MKNYSIHSIYRFRRLLYMEFRIVLIGVKLIKLWWKYGDKSLECTLFWGHFVWFLWRITCFMVYYALIFLLYTRIWFFCVSCKLLDHLPQIWLLNECSLTLYGHPQVSMGVEGRKNRRMSRQSSPRTVRGESITANLFIFLHHFADVDRLLL